MDFGLFEGAIIAAPNLPVGPKNHGKGASPHGGMPLHSTTDLGARMGKGTTVEATGMGWEPTATPTEWWMPISLITAPTRKTSCSLTILVTWEMRECSSTKNFRSRRTAVLAKIKNGAAAWKQAVSKPPALLELWE